MLPDQVSNPGPLTYESGALPIAGFCVSASIKLSRAMRNKTCHRDRIARLTAPYPLHENFNVKLFANAAAAANAGGSTI